MKNSDYSREIFDKYYGIKGQVLLITLRDGTLLEGTLSGFFHGDKSIDEPYIIKWHFIDAKDLLKNDVQSSIDGTEEIGTIIWQADIKSVKFRE